MQAREKLNHSLVTALLALALVLALGCVFNYEGAFFKWGTHRDTLRSASVNGLLACGMTAVIVAGGIDLSVGSVLALTAVGFSVLSIHRGWPAWAAIGASLTLGAVCGTVNGTLIAVWRIQPFIVTLSMMVLARGLAKTLSGGMKVSTVVPAADNTFLNVELPPVFDAIDSRLLGGNVSVVTVVFLTCGALAWILLSRSRWGRCVYALGGNEEAARLSGVGVARVKISVYALAGLLASMAGVCQACQERQGDPEAGAGYELSAIAIVVIGGTSLVGGRGGIGLTLLGTLTIGYIEKIHSINNVPEAGRLMLTGVIIIAAVLLQRNRVR